MFHFNLTAWSIYRSVIDTLKRINDQVDRAKQRSESVFQAFSPALVSLAKSHPLYILQELCLK